MAIKNLIARFTLEVRPLTMMLPVILIGLIVIFYIRYQREMQPRMGTLEWIINFDRPKFSLDGVRFPMETRDYLPMLIITLAYAVVAFMNLGSTDAPQTFVSFTQENSSVILELESGRQISTIMYYSGLYPGDYDLYYSTDGRSWILLEDTENDSEEPNTAAMHQSYADLFKWQYAALNEDLERVRFLQIIARNVPIELGEMALFDKNGELLDVSGVDSVLFDEQETVPESPNWMNSMYFDEIYHGRTAYEHIQNVYPYEITHPPLGKLLIALGIEIFGMTPFGYRFMGTFFGVLMLIPLYVFLKNLFGKTKVACCGTVLFAFEFMHFTQTRIATIDTYGVFFILTSYLFMWRWITAPYAASMKETWKDLALSGLFFGLGCSSKWIVLYSGVGLAMLWLIRVMMLYRERGLAAYGKELGKTVGLSCVFFLLVPAVVYYLCYIPYGTAEGMSLPGMLFSGKYCRLVLENQKYMLTYHAAVNQTHPYSSRWYQWLVDERPILYYLEYDGEMKSAIASFNSPLIAWAGLAALGAMFAHFHNKRSAQALIILIGYFTQFLPWMIIGRTTFAYHYFAPSMFLVLAICCVFSNFMDRSSQNVRYMYLFTGVELGLFAAFYPVLSGAWTTREYCLNFLKWLPNWPLG